VDQSPFKDQTEVHEYARANGLEYVWQGTISFEKRQQTLSPEQFQVRPVTAAREGVVMVGLFPKVITDAEWEAGRPHRERVAEKRRRWRSR
jgi:hypothetical protein